MNRTQRAVLDRARSQLGYVEHGGRDGRSGNVTTFWDWWRDRTGQNWQGESWCGCFASWSYADADAELDMDGLPGFISCFRAEGWFREAGRLVTPATAGPADLALFHFAGMANIANHTGLLESIDLKARTITCIEGNTSAGLAGSQANGGQVARRTRPLSQVRAIGHPPQLDVVDVAVVQEDTMRKYVIVDVPAPRADGAQVVAKDSAGKPLGLWSKTAGATIKANDSGAPVPATVQACAYGDALLLTFVSLVPGKPVPTGKVGVLLDQVA